MRERGGDKRSQVSCDTANHLLYEEYFHLTNIEKDFLAVFKRFYTNEKLRTCPVTGEVMEVDNRYI